MNPERPFAPNFFITGARTMATADMLIFRS